MSLYRILPLARRCFSSTAVQRFPAYGSPSPPRLPEKEQKEFEELQRASTGAFSTPRPRAETASETPSQAGDQSARKQSTGSDQLEARVASIAKGDEFHPDIRRGAPPEFEGDRNPKTGEIGGPKNDPLRWGGEADWSYNGRVTDF